MTSITPYSSLNSWSYLQIILLCIHSHIICLFWGCLAQDMNSFVKGQRRGCSSGMRLGPFCAYFTCHVLLQCLRPVYVSYSRLQHQSTGGSHTSAPSQRLRRVHRATTARLLRLNYIYVHIIHLHSWNVEHGIPLCTFQYTIPLVWHRNCISMVFLIKFHHEGIFPTPRNGPRSASYGPSGPTSCGPLTEWGMERSLVRRRHSSACRQIAQSQVTVLSGCITPSCIFMPFQAWFLFMVLIHNAFVVYLLSHSTHPSWILFQVLHHEAVQVEGKRSSRGCSLTNFTAMSYI